jgi:cell division protein FtsI/penicillin-binding protein 2
MALASLPEFDPNLIDADRRGGLIFNRVTNQVYELGSTFKPLTVAAAIDAGSVTDLGRRYQAARPVSIGGFQIRDSHALGASLNVPQSLIHSSNIVTAQIADELGGSAAPRPWRAGHERAALYRTAGARLPALAQGRLAAHHQHDRGYGHGIAVTPLHLASAYAAMVNGGIWRPATLIKVEPARCRGPPGVQGQHQRADAPAAAHDRRSMAPAARPMRRASGSAARPVRPKSRAWAAIAAPRWWRPSPPPSRWTAALCRDRHA